MLGTNISALRVSSVLQNTHVGRALVRASMSFASVS